MSDEVHTFIVTLRLSKREVHTLLYNAVFSLPDMVG